MRRTFTNVIALSLIALPLVGCARSVNYSQAHYQATKSGYLIVLKGKRLVMVHDPISALWPTSYEAKFVIEVPRIQGVIQGKEIPVPPGYYKYLGQIQITGQNMIVDLYYDDTDDNQKRSVDWNGNYTLSPSDATCN